MKRSGLRPGVTPLARKALKSKRRPSSEFMRIYGSPQRATLIRERPCDVCQIQAVEGRPNHNAHVISGGIGYKAGWRHVVTLCAPCHDVFHYLGSAAEVERVTGVDLKAIAAELAETIPEHPEQAWARSATSR